MVEDFSGSLISRILDFLGFAGKIWISDFTRGNNFSRISGTLFATNFIEVQQCEKGRSNFFAGVFGGNLFSRDSIITDQ